MTPRDRRALRWGIGVVLGAVLLARGVPATWRALHRQQEELEAQRGLLARAETALADLDGLERRASATRAALVALAPRLLTGATEAEAVADLTGRIALAAGRQRTRVVRTDQVGDSAREGRLRRVTVRVQVESDWSGLAGFVQGVLADPAALPIRAVTIRGSEVPAAGAITEVLSGEVEVSGWYLTEPDGVPTGRRGE